MRRWVQSPVLHFVAIGAVLFAVSALRVRSRHMGNTLVRGHG